MKISDNVIVKETGKDARIIGQSNGFWIVEFPNGKHSIYPTNKLKLKP